MNDLRTQLQDGLAGAYRVEHELGRGGMAIVFRAHDVKHDRSVALKVLHPELAAALGPQRFLREIRVAAHLQHPHILTLIDSGEIRPRDRQALDLLYYVMPYVEGESLRERLAREGKLSAEATARILRDVLDALTHAHRLGVVHRDIKPENVMVTRRHALVMDFGVAKAASAAAAHAATSAGAAVTLTALGIAIGTPIYMAPEQALGQADVDARADLYALGVMGYEMLTGQPPFTGPTPQAVLAAQVTQTPRPIGALRPDLPTPFATAIMRCLEKDPAARWQSAEELLDQIETFAAPRVGVSAAAGEGQGAESRRSRPLRAGAAIAVSVVLAAVAWFGPGRQLRAHYWVREQAIPRLLTLSDQGQWEQAYALARRIEAVDPQDSLFGALRGKLGQLVNVHTMPPRARVWRKAYAASDSAWTFLGTTPLESVFLSPERCYGTLCLSADRLRIELPHYRTLELAGFRFGESVIRLDRDTALPPEMVRVPGGEIGVFYPALEQVKPIALGDYLIDRFEVTNEEFKRFVDAGGYRRREFWDYPFVKAGAPLSWEKAMAQMTDRTGRPGPSTWEAADYPPGQERYPVAGVSWYEAAAFAKFADKSLPTVFHWNRAASVYLSASIVPASNFAGRGAVPVGSTRGISAYGTYDMAGNVREWCFNASGSERFILGGGWNDEPYTFSDPYTQPPFDRSPTNGIRLVKYPAEPNLSLARAPLQRARRTFLNVRPVSDAVFAAYRRMYEYDRTPLNARIVQTVEEGSWRRELVRLNAAYAGDSLLLYLYVPQRAVRPYPVVVYFPGSNAIGDVAPQNLQVREVDFIIKSGRTVLYPVYKGTYQRSDSLRSDAQDSTNFYRDHVVMWAKDLGRGIDYLETRPEIDVRHLAYYGLSWGGAMGALMPAVEPRIKVSVLYVAGLHFGPVRPEADPVTFLPRIRIPTLMINGRYDFYVPLETSQIPMFRLLGTPANQKRQVVEEGSHFVPRTRLIQEVLSWLDKYQPLPQ